MVFKIFVHRYKPNKNIDFQVSARVVHFIVFADIAPLTRMRERRSIYLQMSTLPHRMVRLLATFPSIIVILPNMVPLQ